MREAKCHLVMGEVAAATMSYQQVLRLDPNNTVAATEVKYRMDFILVLQKIGFPSIKFIQLMTYE